MLTKLFRPTAVALGIVTASLFLGANALAKDWHHDKHYKHYKPHSAKDVKSWVLKLRSERPSLKALQEQIAALQGDVEALTKLVEALQVDLQAQVGELSADLESVQSDMADLQSRIEANMGDVEAMKAQLADDEAAAGILKADLDALNDQLALLEQAKQNAIPLGCPPDSAMQQVLPDGSVVCTELGGGTAGGGQLATAHISRQGPVYAGQAMPVSVACPPGFVVTGGGYNNPDPGVQVYSSFAQDDWTWTVRLVNNHAAGSPPVLLMVEAYCASVQ